MSKLSSLSMRRATAQVLLVFALALPVLQSAHAQSRPWPTRKFQVVEMTQDEIAHDTGGTFNDAIDAVVGAFSDDVAGDPARARQRAQVEHYLGQVAHQLEAWGFPPPALGRVVALENGELAYRVYSVASVGASRYVPSNGGDGANGGHLRLNLRDPQLSQALDFQNYATIAHELFHAVQYNTRFFSVEPGMVGDWITEGQAEAVGEDLALAYAPPDASRDTMDWGRRSYSRPLPIARRDPGGTGQAYDTASFWRYLAERDHLNLTAGPTVLPGIANPAGAVRYGYLASLLSNPPQPRDCHADDDRCRLELQWLDAGLRGYDNFQQPLRKVFPEFAVTMAAYGDPGGRVSADNSSGLGADYWRSGVLPDCVKEIVDGPILEYSRTLRLHGVSANCVYVPDFFNDATEVFVEAHASGSELLDQIVFGLAGIPKSAKPMLTDIARAHGETSAAWPVRLTPGRDNVLVFVNIALDAPETEDQELEVVISREYASIGAPANDSGSIADAIDTPLEMEFGEYRGYVHPGDFEKNADSFVGKQGGVSQGIVEPCIFRMKAWQPAGSDRSFVQDLHISLQTAGPITPGRYPIAPWVDPRTKSGSDWYTDMFPQSAVATVTLNDIRDYPADLAFESGTLTIDSINRSRVVGHIAGVAHLRSGSSDPMPQYTITESRTLAAKFSLRVRNGLGAKRYSDAPYPCIDPGN